MNARHPAFFFVVLACAGLGLAYALWDEAFPTAAMEVKLSREDAGRRMREWIEAEGFSLEGYRSVVVFGEEDGEENPVKTYVELEHGLPTLERSVERGMLIWYWYGRWFRPEQQEQFEVDLDMRGSLVGYRHTIAEGEASPSLSKEDARALAMAFLRAKVRQHPVERLRFIEDSVVAWPRRTDYTFTWALEDLRLGDAAYHLEVVVQGDRIGGYSEAFQVPEAWTRDYHGRKAMNGFLRTLAEYASFPLGAAALVLLIVYTYQGRLRWWTALPRGWAWLLLVVFIADALNGIPLVMATYDTQESWAGYLVKAVDTGLMQVLKYAAGVWLLAVIAEPLYREQLPQNLPFELALGADALRRRETLRGIGIGAAFACWGIGYVCLFYVLARHWGAWVPVDVNYSMLLSGWAPWAEPMAMALKASFYEEFLFRALAICLCLKFLRSRVLAILLPAVVWAFMHSDYPQMPAYVRGIELTFEGILWGWLMVRYGIVASLVTHYLYDAWIGALVLAQSSEWSHRVGSMVVSFWPLALGLWGWWHYGRRGEWIETRDLAPARPLLQPGRFGRWWEEAAKPWDLVPPSLGVSARSLLIGGSILMIVALYFVPSPQDCLRDLGGLSKSRKEIIACTDELMRARGQDPGRFQRITSVEGNSLPSKYMLQHGTLEWLSGLFRSEFPDVKWESRYFRFAEREEFRFTLDREGRLISWAHAVPRERPGASLDKEVAREKARRDLASVHGVDFSREALAQDDTRSQARRRDHFFTFRRTDWRCGESELRTSVTVQGDEVVGFQRWMKLPQDWLNRERAKSLWDDLVEVLERWVDRARIALMLFLCLVMIERNILPWRPAFAIALIPTLLGWLDWINAMPWFYAGYDTATPVRPYLVTAIGNLARGSLLNYLLNVLVATVALGLMRWAFNWGWRDMVIWPRDVLARRRVWLDALAFALLTLAVWNLRGLVSGEANGWLFPHRVAAYSIPAVNFAQPWLGLLTRSFSDAYSTTIEVAMKVAGCVILYRRFPRLVWVVLLVNPVYAALGERTWGEFWLSAALGEFQFFIALALVWRVWRFHAPAVFLSFLLQSLFGPVETLIRKGGASSEWQVAALLLVVAVFAWRALRPLSGAKGEGAVL